MKKYKYVTLLMAFMVSPALAQNYEITMPKITPKNEIHKHCMEKYGYHGLNGGTDFSSIGACITEIRAEIRKQKETELWEFIKKNPQYRFPGVSIGNGQTRPVDPCWGKARTYSTSSGRTC